MFVKGLDLEISARMTISELRRLSTTISAAHDGLEGDDAGLASERRSDDAGRATLTIRRARGLADWQAQLASDTACNHWRAVGGAGAAAAALVFASLTPSPAAQRSTYLDMVERKSVP